MSDDPNQPFYESDKALTEYLLFHYGAAEEILPYADGPSGALDYPARCVTECLSVDGVGDAARGRGLGCAVGRSSFELARHCQEVVGIDFSARFIEAANALAKEGSLPYRYLVEGDRTAAAIARAPEGVDLGRVRFEQGDAMNLREGLGRFDVVLMANLIDRLSSPKACLSQLSDLVRPGGQLIITSPYTWLEEYTPRANWLAREGRGTRDGLKDALSADFSFEGAKNLPFLIREHARKCQWSVAEATLWRRRS